MHLELRNLSKRFGRTQALDQVNLEIKGPGLIFLVGPNASGKTTLFKSILGLVRADSGSLYYKGQQILPSSTSIRQSMGYMPQVARFPQNLTARDLFSLTKPMRRMDQAPDTDLYEAFNVDQFADQPMVRLSGGTRQKVLAALAFYYRPELVVLDEPTAGLDPEHSKILLDKLYAEQSNKLIIMSTHILYEANRMGQGAVYLNDGHLIFNRSMSDLREACPEGDTHMALLHAMKRQA